MYDKIWRNLLDRAGSLTEQERQELTERTAAALKNLRKYHQTAVEALGPVSNHDPLWKELLDMVPVAGMVLGDPKDNDPETSWAILAFALEHPLAFERVFFAAQAIGIGIAIQKELR